MGKILHANPIGMNGSFTRTLLSRSCSLAGGHLSQLHSMLISGHGHWFHPLLPSLRTTVLLDPFKANFPNACQVQRMASSSP